MSASVQSSVVRWGVLGAAKIAVRKVVPGMARSPSARVDALASRDLAKARAAARELGLARVYGSYEELLKDPEIDAVYVPLPNHLHVPWSIAALEAGKHVLCEKPIGLDAAEARRLLDASRQYPDLRVMEAFMYRFHPQWQKAKEIVDEGGIGRLKSIHSFFSYMNHDPENVRNKKEMGGGGLMDIGCYCISLARFLFAAEPTRVLGTLEIDPDFGVDRLATGILEFADGQASFTCATQLAPHQRVQVVGTEGRVEIEIPFNAPPDHPCRLWHERGDERREVVFEVCDQYTIQGELFSRAILDAAPVPTPLEDAVANMEVLDKLVQSHETGGWVAGRRGGGS